MVCSTPPLGQLFINTHMRIQPPKHLFYSGFIRFPPLTGLSSLSMEI